MSAEEFAPFWMVYGIGQGSPTYHHGSEAKALTEAQRLANRYPGTKFCVMPALFVVEKKTVTVRKLVAGKYVEVDIDDDKIPF